MTSESARDDLQPEDQELARVIVSSGLKAKEIRGFMKTLAEIRGAAETDEPAPRGGYE